MGFDARRCPSARAVFGVAPWIAGPTARLGWRSLLLACALALSSLRGTGAAPLASHGLGTQPFLHFLEGYIDRAPRDVRVVDEVEITAAGRSRKLLVAAYHNPNVLLDRYLSRSTVFPYALRGPKGEVVRVIDAPEGTFVKGVFAAYTDNPPSLVIADLVDPR